MKLCQVIAVESKVKAKAHEGISKIYQNVSKVDLLSGFARSYSPLEDGPNAEQLPSEKKKVQLKVEDLLKDVQTTLSELFDLTATKDFANCEARADIVVGEAVLAKDVPVTYLLFLEKKLTDLHTLMSKLPTLDAAENWTYDVNQSCYSAEPKKTHRTKKVLKVLTLAQATDKHPAQAKEYTEDVVTGYWTTLTYSGALPADRVRQLTFRVETLQKAVKFAREEANSREVVTVKVADKLFNYLLGA